MFIGILNKCVEEASKSTYKHKIGAVIFKGKKILGYGHNEIRYTEAIPNKYKYYINSLHAEQSAILSVKNWELLKDTSILVLRINNYNKLFNAKPCLMCQTMINHVNIKNIYYSTEEGTIIKLRK